MSRVVILTGGIGSGKSTVASLLTRCGAHVVDADQLAREVVAPGTEGLAEVVRAFGSAVLAPDQTLDRAALAKVVFADPERLAALEHIVHPRVERLAEERLAGATGAPLVVYEVPLPGRGPRLPRGLATDAVPVVVVDVPDDLRRERLRERGLPDDQITARMAAQPSRQQWLEAADVVIDNSGDLDALSSQVASLWLDLTGTPAPVGVSD